MQYSTRLNAAFLNLDYAADHPIIHYPLDDDTADYFVDRSAQKDQIRHQDHWKFQFTGWT